MTELSGTAAVGIEAVEWLNGAAGNLTVRVTGRWRRRRPASSGQASLVVEADGQRHRFPAMPDPPSLGGAAPGTWRLSFSVPGALAPGPGGHAWLSMGTVMVPLPASDDGQDERQQLAEREQLNASLAEGEREQLAASLAEGEREQLAASLAEGERIRRIAEQRAHAEQALRRDLARRLSQSEREIERARQALGDLATAEERIRRLEALLSQARRRGDEAEQLAAAAVAARARAEHQAVARRPGDPRSLAPESARLRFERQLRVRRAEAGSRVPAEPPAVAAWPPAEPPLVVARPPAEPPAVVSWPPGPAPSTLVETLRRELDARARAEAPLRARLVAAETRLAARVLLDERTVGVLTELRDELDRLRSALAGERARRELAERDAAELPDQRSRRESAERRIAELERELGSQRDRTRDAHDAIAQLRGSLDTPPPATMIRLAPDPPDPGPVRADRLSDALERLRESVTPPGPEAVPDATETETDNTTDADAAAAADPAPAVVAAVRAPPGWAAAATGPTLRTAFRRLVRSDADAAGRLLLELLALQPAVYPHPIAYDLVLGPGRGCVRVSVGPDAATVELHGAARTREEVDFRITGTPARIARLMVAHGIWRRIGARVARVRGRREGLAALDALLAVPLDLPQLRGSGLALAPASVLALVAAMVPGDWTAGERFTLAHHGSGPGADSRAYLLVRDGRPLLVTDTAPAGRIATTITGSADDLLAVILGAAAPEAHIVGDRGPLATVREWVKRAQGR